MEINVNCRHRFDFADVANPAAGYSDCEKCGASYEAVKSARAALVVGKRIDRETSIGGISVEELKRREREEKNRHRREDYATLGRGRRR